MASLPTALVTPNATPHLHAMSALPRLSQSLCVSHGCLSLRQPISLPKSISSSFCLSSSALHSVNMHTRSPHFIFGVAHAVGSVQRQACGSRTHAHWRCSKKVITSRGECPCDRRERQQAHTDQARAPHGWSLSWPPFSDGFILNGRASTPPKLANIHRCAERVFFGTPCCHARSIST